MHPVYHTVIHRSQRVSRSDAAPARRVHRALPASWAGAATPAVIAACDPRPLTVFSLSASRQPRSVRWPPTCCERPRTDRPSRREGLEMKRIEAVIKPFEIDEAKAALDQIG